MNNSKRHTLACILFLPLLRGGHHHAVHAAQSQDGQRRAVHRRDCRRLRSELLFIAAQRFGDWRARELSVNWLSIGELNVDFGLQLDALSLMMLLIVTGVGSAIHIYSFGYMHDDPGFSRFFACLSLFTFSMLGIVLANNFLQCSSSGNWSACRATCSSGSGLKNPARRTRRRRPSSRIASATSVSCWAF